MRDNKYDNLLKVSIVILIGSSIMLCITGYNIFFKENGISKNAVSALSPAKKQAVRDSLQRIYSSTIRTIDNNLQLAGDVSSDDDTKTKLTEMSTLREEINSLLKAHGSDEDLATAKQKIEELQQKVAELQNRYTSVESENKRLQALLNKLIATDKNYSGNAAAENSKVNNTPERNSYSSSFMIGSLHLFAVAETNDQEKETNNSDVAEKMVGSFSLKNISAKTSGEIVVVVLQPDGKVVKNSVWESGTFETKEGKKIYSRKLYFEPAADDRQLNFSLTPDKFLKGDYTMQIWYNGNMVGKMTRTLS